MMMRTNKILMLIMRNRSNIVHTNSWYKIASWRNFKHWQYWKRKFTLHYEIKTVSQTLFMNKGFRIKNSSYYCPVLSCYCPAPCWVRFMGRIQEHNFSQQSWLWLTLSVDYSLSTTRSTPKVLGIIKSATAPSLRAARTQTGCTPLNWARGQLSDNPLHVSALSCTDYFQSRTFWITYRYWSVLWTVYSCENLLLAKFDELY